MIFVCYKQVYGKEWIVQINNQTYFSKPSTKQHTLSRWNNAITF
jgi:hypothetical protein